MQNNYSYGVITLQLFIDIQLFVDVRLKLEYIE